MAAPLTLLLLPLLLCFFSYILLVCSGCSYHKEKGSFNPSRERDKLSLGLGNNEHTGSTKGLGKRMTWKHGFEEDRHMCKKHGIDQEANLELQVKALVVKALEEQGLSTELWI